METATTLYLGDRNGAPLRPGDRVSYQVSPRLAWATGTVGDDGRSVRSDYNGTVGTIWPEYTERLAA